MKLAKLLLLVFLGTCVSAQVPTSGKEVDAVYSDAHALYLDLHEHPELSAHENQTATKLAGRLRSLGYDVTEHVGGTGVVAILKNGPGPTIMLRTELDALPVEEKTGLPYASKVHAKDDAGHDVPVMHACGHDLHMASIVGTAAIMAHSKDTWHGTLMLIGQPAEETISGAKKMLEDGLFQRFPKPDVGVALHVSNAFPAGKVGVGSGDRYANADSVRVTIYGKGGHGSAPHTTIDPIVIAATTILSLQTIVSREVKPGETAVVTVGYVSAGLKNNIIPDQAELGLTIRTFKPEIRKQILAAVARIVKAEAEAGGATREPLIEHYESTDAVYNEPALAQRLRGAARSRSGKRKCDGRGTNHRIGRLLLLHRAGRSLFLFWAWGSGASGLCPGERGGNASAVQSLFAVRAGCGSCAAYGNCGGGSSAEKSVAGVGRGVAEVDWGKMKEGHG